MFLAGALHVDAAEVGSSEGKDEESEECEEREEGEEDEAKAEHGESLYSRVTLCVLV